MEERTHHGQSSDGARTQEARMPHCARLAHLHCACCAACRPALRPRSATAAFDMAPTVSCARSIMQYSANARAGALSHVMLRRCSLLCACVRNSVAVLAAATGRQSGSSLAIRPAATAALLHSSAKPRTSPQLLQPPLSRPRPLRLRHCSRRTQAATRHCRSCSAQQLSCWRSKGCREA